MSDPGQIDPRTEALLNYLMQGGQQRFGAATPTLSPAQLNLMGGILPQDPDELKYERDATNAAQDQASLMADTMFLAQAGPGAYAPGSFNPMTTTSAITSPELDQFLSYVRNPRSYMGRIASYLRGIDPNTNEPMPQGEVTTEEAVAFIRNEIETNPDTPEMQALLAQLPHPMNTVTGAEQSDVVDWGQVTEDARFVSNAYYAIPQAGPFEEGERSGTREWVFDESGMPTGMVETTSEPTQSMEEYDRLGLPYPTEEFTPEYILGPEFQQQGEQFQATGADPMQQAYLNLLVARDEMQNFQPGSYTRQGVPPQQQGALEEEAIPAPVRNYPVEEMDVTAEMPSALDAAIRDGADTTKTWMDLNWETMSDIDRASSREVLASWGLTAENFGYEVAPHEEHPGAVEDISSIPGAVIGTSQTSGLPVSQAGFVAGEAAETLEGLLGDQQATTSWLQANYPNLDPQEVQQVREVLSSYGLTVEDYVPAAGSGGNRQQTRLSPFAPGTKTPESVRSLYGIGPGERGEPIPVEELWGGNPVPPLPPDPNGTVMNAVPALQPEPEPGRAPNYGGQWPGYQGPQPPQTPGYTYSAGRYQQGIPPARTTTEQNVYLDYLGGGMMSGNVPPYPQPEPEPVRAPNYGGQWPGYNANGLTDGEIAEIFPGGTGAITDQNYGGGPRPTPPYVYGGSAPQQTPPYVYGGGQPPTSMEAMLNFLRSGGIPSGGIRTGEEQREPRTEEERRRLAEERAPQGLTPADVTTGGQRPSRRGRYEQDRQIWMDATRDYMNQRNQVYGEDYGRAWAQSYMLQQQGVTPTIAALAARQLVPQAMGIYTPPELR